MPKNQNAFTLTELMVVLTIVGATAAVAIEGWDDINRDARADAAVAQWVDALGYARRTAIAINEPVTWCPVNRPADDCGERDAWHLGSLIFADANANQRLDAGEKVLRHLTGFPMPVRWYWRSFRSRIDLTMAPNGYTDWQNGSFLYCPDGADSTYARLIVLNAAGRIRIGRDTDGDGRVENTSGEPIVCPTT